MCGSVVVHRGVRERECGCRGCVAVCGGVLGWLCACVTVPRLAVSLCCEFTPRALAGCCCDGWLPVPKRLSPCTRCWLPGDPRGDVGSRLPQALAAPASTGASVLAFGCVVACWILWLLGARRRRMTPRKERGPEVTLSHGAGPPAVIHHGLALPSAQTVGGAPNLCGRCCLSGWEVVWQLVVTPW